MMAAVSSPAQAAALRRRRSSACSTRRCATTTAGARPRPCSTQERIEDFYASDVSISAGFFGTLVDHTGVFGEAERFAAAGAGRRPDDVLRPRLERLELRRAADARAGAPRRAVLVARNIHHSIINALKAFGLDFRFLPDALRRASSRRCCRRASSRSCAGCARYPEALAVIYTSPTYEGLAREHRATSRRRSTTPRRTALVFVDEAWGGHLHFHPELPLVGDGRGRRPVRAVDAQAGRRPAADRR